VKPGRHGVVAALLGFVMSLGLQAIPAQQECPDDTCPLVAPSGVHGIVSNATAMQISWDDVPKAYAYRIQVAPQNNFVGDRVITFAKREPATPKPFVIPNLDAGTTYHVRVSAIDRAQQQQSEWSAPAVYATKGPMQLSVGTYNIHNPRDDDWDERGPAVAEQIVSEKLGVLGLQEVYRKWERRSLLGYVNANAAKAMGGPVYAMAPEPDSDVGYDNRILYDTRLFTLLGAGGGEFDHQVGGDEVDRWFAWATFRHRASGWKVLFVTTHLAPHNRRAARKQWNELIDRINDLRRAHRAPWIVVAGDFNTTKFDKPANDLLEKMDENGYGDVLGQEYRSYDTDDSRAQATKDVWLDSFNGFDPHIDHYDHNRDHAGNNFDWIFASNELAVPYYRVVARYDDDGKLSKPIPSDHFLVHATLAYVPPQSNRSTVKVAETVDPSSVN
jgi:endonuclease/exonuclease/phosphatase family metal-dependent hydrolase